MLSRDTLRYKQIQSEIVYRREICALGKARRSEACASEAVRAREQLFWKEVTRLSSGSNRNHLPTTGLGSAPLDRIIAAHAQLLEAKLLHSGARGELQAGITRVSQSEALCSKVRDLTEALKQRWAALLEGRRSDEVTEMLTQLPLSRRNESAVAPSRGTESELSLGAARDTVSGVLGVDRVVPERLAAPPVAAQPLLERPISVCTSAPAVGSVASIPRETPTVHSVEFRPAGEGPSLRVQSVLSNGAPVTISLTRSGAGGISAVVESPNIGIATQLIRERANLLTKLGGLGVSLSGLEVRRGSDAAIGADRPVRRPRWIEEDEDESGIA